MHTTPIPTSEVRRLAALQKLRLMGTPAEERFDKITRLAKRTFGVPIAIINLVGGTRTWLKSVQGLDVCEVPREESFCRFTIQSGDVCHAPDTHLDPRFANSPFANAGDQSLRFYAGYALVSDGEFVGVLCIADYKPRTLSTDDLTVLRDLADLAEQEVNVAKLAESQNELALSHEHLEERALVDGLTRVWNRGAICELAVRELESARLVTRAPVGLMLVDVDHFKKINDTYGHPAGDEALRQIAAHLRAGIRSSDAVGRYGGEEFLVVLPGCSEAELFFVADAIRARIARTPVELAGQEISMSVSIGITLASDGSQSIDRLIQAADKALYRAKHTGRDRVSFDWLSAAARGATVRPAIPAIGSSTPSPLTAPRHEPL